MILTVQKTDQVTVCDDLHISYDLRCTEVIHMMSIPLCAQERELGQM
jgi:hypothetical protein